MTSVAVSLAEWSTFYEATAEDHALAERSLRDTLAVALAAADHPLKPIARQLGKAGRWAAAAHVLDFDDLHMESTAHISAVVVPAVVASGGDAHAYLAGAGVMARLGQALGWPHFSRGWHPTCTAGAPAAAVAAARSMTLNVSQTAHAIALAVSAASGFQRTFGTDAKALQVGFATETGVRAARLAAAGARAGLDVVEQWLGLLGASATTVELGGNAIPGGLGIKLHPCCYALQRPISATRQAFSDLDERQISEVVISAPASAVVPLIHHRPTTGLQGKFSLEYAFAATILDGYPDLKSFTDEAVARPEAQRLLATVRTSTREAGDSLLAGSVEIEVRMHKGSRRRTRMVTAPGTPDLPATAEDLAQKFASCGSDVLATLEAASWERAPELFAW